MCLALKSKYNEGHKRELCKKAEFNRQDNSKNNLLAYTVTERTTEIVIDGVIDKTPSTHTLSNNILICVECRMSGERSKRTELDTIICVR